MISRSLCSLYDRTSFVISSRRFLGHRVGGGTRLSLCDRRRDNSPRRDMMPAQTVLVTGVCGRIGRGIASALKKLHPSTRVVGVDVAAATEGLVGPVVDSFVQVDLVAAAAPGPAHDALRSAATGVNCVVHCAAWPGPSATPPPAVVACGSAMKKPAIGLETASPAVLLRDNVASTSAVCDAAVAAGASRFVFSSSAFAMGYSHVATGAQAWTPRYIPVDEAHGAMPQETYGLSKLMGEGVLEAAARTAHATSFVSLRFTNIVKRELWGSLPWPAPTADQPLPLILWAYTHEDDVIDAHVAAATRAEAAAAGAHEAYVIAASDTRFAEPTMELLSTALDMPKIECRGPPHGSFSPLCADKARERLGFSPRSWRDAPPISASAVPLRGSPAAHRALADPALAHFDLSGFELGCGATLPDGATLGYKVHGPPIGQSKGVILHPTSYDAVHDELEYNIGVGKTLDTSEYTVHTHYAHTPHTFACHTAAPLAPPLSPLLTLRAPLRIPLSSSGRRPQPNGQRGLLLPLADGSRRTLRQPAPPPLDCGQRARPAGAAAKPRRRLRCRRAARNGLWILDGCIARCARGAPKQQQATRDPRRPTPPPPTRHLCLK